MKRVLIPAVVTICATLILVVLLNGIKGNAVKNEGDTAGDFTLLDLDGVEHQLSDYKGKTVVLNFFTTWCEPCQAEAPELEAFGTGYEDAVLLVIAKGEPRQRVRKFVEEQSSELMFLMDTKEEVSKKFNIVSQPETIIIDKQGVIRKKISGQTTEKALIDAVTDL